MIDRPLLLPTILFVLLAVLVTTVGLVGERNLGALSDGFSRVTHSRALLDELSGIRADVLAAQSASRGYRLTGEPEFLVDFDEARQHGYERLDRLRGLTEGHAARQARLDSLVRECEDMFVFFATLHDLARDLTPDAPSRTISARGGRPLIERVEARVEAIRASELALLEVRTRHAERTYLIARLAGFALAAASLLLGVLVYVLFAQTVRAQAREAREQHLRADELAEADRRKDEFLAVLGHELRNPLAPMRMALHVLEHEAAPAAALARARAILDQQVAQMARLVDDLMDVSRVTLGKLSLQRVPTDLRGLAQAVAESALPIMAEHGHRFELTCPATSLELSVDPTRIRQAVVNLLINAAKYTEPGGSIRLHVLIDEAGREILFRVEDNGRGLTPEELGRIFAPFEQGTVADDQAEGGIGVGLTLARRLVEMHGGSVSARSPGRGLGSTFEVRLPKGAF